MTDRVAGFRIPISIEVLIVIVVSWIAYAPSLWNGFVYDDEKYVVRNPLVQAPLDLRRVFGEAYPPGEGDRGLYRPLVTLSYHVDARLWGMAERGKWNGFHRTNLLWHAFNGVLLLIILRRLGLSRGARMVSVLIFCLQPALSEAVAWVVGRAELMGLSMGLLALLSFLWRPRGIGLLMAGFFWVLAMLCKEQWVVWPALAAAVVTTVPLENPPDRLRLARLGVWAGLIVIGFWMARYMVLENWCPTVSAYGSISWSSRIATSLGVLWKYVGLWFWPIHLSVHHDIRPIPFLHGAVYLLAWVVVGWGGWRGRQIFPWGILALGWFWVAILPVSNLLVPIGAISGERFMYASTLFFAPALVEAVRRWLLHDGQFRTAGILFATAICLLLMTRLQSRLEDWKSNLTLWQAASRCYPQCYGIKAQLAFALFEEKQYGDAYSLAEEALVQGRQAPQPYQQHIEPRLVQLRAKAEVNMREQARKKLLAEIHRQTMPLPPEESLKVLLSQSKQLSEEPRFHDVVGDAYMRLGRSAEALREYEIAAKLDPSCTEFRYKCDRARERAAGRKPGSARSPEKH